MCEDKIVEKRIWDQLKNVTAKELIQALQKDGWKKQLRRGAVQSFLNLETNEILTIHYHPKKTYGQKLLKELISRTRWTEEDLRHLKLIR